MFDALTMWVERALSAGGSFALGLIMFLENVFPPIPSELVLPYAGFLVGQGTVSWPQALVASTVGSVLGAVALYALGRYGGRPVILRYRRVLRFTERDLDRADAWFDRHGPKIVFFARMVPIARSVVSIPAGWSEMPMTRFLVLTTLGTLAWNALLIGGGYLLGENYERVGEVAGTYSNVILLVVVAAAVAVLVWWVRRHPGSAARVGGRARRDVD